MQEAYENICERLNYLEKLKAEAASASSKLSAIRSCRSHIAQYAFFGTIPRDRNCDEVIAAADTKGNIFTAAASNIGKTLVYSKGVFGSVFGGTSEFPPAAGEYPTVADIQAAARDEVNLKWNIADEYATKLNREISFLQIASDVLISGPIELPVASLTPSTYDVSRVIERMTGRILSPTYTWVNDDYASEFNAYPFIRHGNIPVSAEKINNAWKFARRS